MGVGTGVGVGVGAGVGDGVGTGVGVGAGDGVGGGVGTGVGVTCRARVIAMLPSPDAFGRAMAKKKRQPAISRKNTSHPTMAPALSFLRFLDMKTHPYRPKRGISKNNRSHSQNLYCSCFFDEMPLELVPSVSL